MPAENTRHGGPARGIENAAKNAVDGSLKNDAGVDWFAFQEALGKLGYMI